MNRARWRRCPLGHSGVVDRHSNTHFVGWLRLLIVLYSKNKSVVETAWYALWRKIRGDRFGVSQMMYEAAGEAEMDPEYGRYL